MNTVLSDLTTYTLVRELQDRISFKSNDLELIKKEADDNLELYKSREHNFEYLECIYCGEEKSSLDMWGNTSTCNTCYSMNKSRNTLITVLRAYALKMLPTDDYSHNMEYPCDSCNHANKDNDDECTKYKYPEKYAWDECRELIEFTKIDDEISNLNLESNNKAYILATEIASKTINEDHVKLHYMIKQSEKLMADAKQSIIDKDRYLKNEELRTKDFIIETGLTIGCDVVYKNGDKYKIYDFGYFSRYSVRGYKYKKNGEVGKNSSGIDFELIDYIIKPFNQTN